jgi:hypothetical protein
MSWTQQHSGTTSDINAVSWVGNKLVAVGAHGTVWTARP